MIHNTSTALHDTSLAVIFAVLSDFTKTTFKSQKHTFKKTELKKDEIIERRYSSWLMKRMSMI